MAGTPDQRSLTALDGPWAALLAPGTPVQSLAALRPLPGLLAARHREETWVRGPSWQDAAVLVAAVPWAALFRTGDRGRLFPPGALLPVRRLPETAWRPLAETLQPELPPAAFSGSRPPERLPLRLQPDPFDRREPNLMRISLEIWVRFCERAPGIRLDPLQFAASPTQALILGTPAPPLPGVAFHLSGRIALACGSRFEPGLDPETAAAWLGLAPSEFAVFEPGRAAERISLESFVRATRSAARLTLAHLAAAQTPADNS